VSVDVEAARLAWERLDAACAGLLARQCKSHRPYMGCPLDCNDVESALDPEHAEARPLINAALDEIEALRVVAEQAEIDKDCLRRNHKLKCEQLAMATTQRDTAITELAAVRAELQQARDDQDGTERQRCEMREHFRALLKETCDIADLLAAETGSSGALDSIAAIRADGGV
jgi:hypothetical protein